MKSDKILVILALTIALTAFIFRARITEEIQLFGQSEVNELIERFSPAQIYFYPLSQQERRKVLTEHVEKMKSIQQRISKTVFAKQFLDFSHYISEREKELMEREIEALFGADAISFTTANYNTVIANPQFSKEPLLKLGFLIDDAFPEEESNDAIYAIDIEDGRIVVNISPLEIAHLAEACRYRKFVDQVSKEAFDSEPVSLNIIIPDDKSELIFRSKHQSCSYEF